MSIVSCRTLELKQLNDQIFRVRLKADAPGFFDFKGGQYLFLLLADGRRIPLSIASAPEETQFIELHIRLTNEGGLVSEMLELFRSNEVFEIDGPYGRCVLQNGERDLVIIAGGTGFSPMKSLIESAIAQSDPRKISLYLGAQSSEDLYQTPLIESWQNQNNQVRYVPVLGQQCEGWQGETGFPHEVALRELQSSASERDFYVSGSEAMVLNVYQALADAGVDKARIYSDILDIKRDQGQDI